MGYSGNFSSSIIESDGKKHLETPNIKLYENEKYLMNIEDENKILKYSYFDSPNPNEVLTLEYSNFKNYDHYLAINLPEDYTFTFMKTLGFLNQKQRNLKQGFELSADFNFPKNNYSLIGYLDGYESYQTTITVHTDYHQYIYEKIGEKVLNFEIPTLPELVIGGGNIKNLEINSSEDYIRKEIRWENPIEERQNDKYVLWYINSPKLSSSTSPNLPEELLLKYPIIKIEDMSYYNISIFTKGINYQDFVKRTFNETNISPTEVNEMFLYNSF